MNPVLTTLSLFLTAFGSVGIWTFASLFLTRKADTKVKNVDAAVDLESASREYRKEVAAERDAIRRRLGVFSAVVIPLLRTIDSFLPKVAQYVEPDEVMLVRSQVDAVWKAVEP